MLYRRLILTLLWAFCLIAAQPLGARLALGSGASLGWPSYNNDLGSRRYVALDQITTSNVSRLHVVCAAQLGGPINFQTGPIVVGGVLYATRSNQTIALNAATCGVLWTYPYEGSKVTQRTHGVAYWGGLVYRGFANGHVIAMNAATGAKVWDSSVIAAGSVEYIDAAPVVWNGSVIIGTADGDSAQVCHIVALSAQSGKVLWTQQTVPNVGAPAAQTWQGATHIAGGSMWTSFSVDASTGKLFVPIGNPEPDFDDRQRQGTNLYTNSVLELNPTTGALEAAMQLTPADDHDWDQGTPPAIVTRSNGTKIALAAGKDGYLRAVSLSTLALLWRTPVTTILNATAPIVTTGTHYCPYGAVFWNGPAYSPATGLAYVNATDWCVTVDRSANPQPYVAGGLWTGSSNFFGKLDTARSGWLNAIDVATGAVRWRYHSSLPLVAGVTPTAGGLVFTADLLGNVLAFDSATGSLLATVPTNLPVGGGVISYEVSGTQYVAVAAGMTGGFQTPRANSAIVILSL